ncbi:hypothetical protein SAMN05443529_101367 [Desulfosporosinus hippei DSM 8344]|uniref:Uncharacterized protein n=1 Tax=Desulfosporosinus hippei DSM 8344 TaxID=1121419 RepID=A0A1G7SDZ6_9FIRM|nr:hypothetical protein SAMN05443529_101367 [Desulfosporosinus hippei DSM 8344]
MIQRIAGIGSSTLGSSLEKRWKVQAVVGDFGNSPWSCVQVAMNTGVSRYNLSRTI